MEAETPTLAEALRAAMAAKGHTQTHAAEALHTSKENVNRWCRYGAPATPDAAYYDALMAYLGVDFRELAVMLALGTYRRARGHEGHVGREGDRDAE